MKKSQIVLIACFLVASGCIYSSHLEDENRVDGSRQPVTIRSFDDLRRFMQEFHGTDNILVHVVVRFPEMSQTASAEGESTVDLNNNRSNDN